MNLKRILTIVITLLLFLILILEILILNRKQMLKNGYFPLDEIMKINGFYISSENIYKKNDNNIEITISFDFENNICTKNLYSFDISGAHLDSFNKKYIYKENLENILNCKLSYDSLKIISNDITFNQHEWTNITNLIAHAGGACREKTSNTTYTNSLEAIIENYNLGHRVFEIDFYLTSDSKLAAVHDWTDFGSRNGIPLSSEEWIKQPQTFGSDNKVYTTLLLEDILNEMLVNKDMFIVTDTKATEFTKEEAKLEFQLIYDEAIKRDPELINRIIPQIYNTDMYNMLESIYHFPSVIFTTYSTTASSDEIIDFSSKHDNIKVITAPALDSRFTPEAILKLHQAGLLIYNNTLNRYEDFSILSDIDGFYTDVLLPKDIQIYKDSIK